MLAIVIQGPGEATLEEVSKPTLRDNYLIVKVTAVALNVNYFLFSFFSPTSSILELQRILTSSSYANNYL